MSAGELDIGIALNLETGIDVTTATVTKILYRKPSGTTGAWTASTSSTTVSYQTSTNDLDESGVWELQAYIEIGALKVRGSIAKLRVVEALDG